MTSRTTSNPTPRPSSTSPTPWPPCSNSSPPGTPSWPPDPSPLMSPAAPPTTPARSKCLRPHPPCASSRASRSHRFRFGVSIYIIHPLNHPSRPCAPPCPAVSRRVPSHPPTLTTPPDSRPPAGLHISNLPPPPLTPAAPSALRAWLLPSAPWGPRPYFGVVVATVTARSDLSTRTTAGVPIPTTHSPPSVARVGCPQHTLPHPPAPVPSARPRDDHRQIHDYVIQPGGRDQRQAGQPAEARTGEVAGGCVWDGLGLGRGWEGAAACMNKP